MRTVNALYIFFSFRTNPSVKWNRSFDSIQHPESPDLAELCPDRWEASVIAHTITLPWVASLIPASFGLPLGESVMPGKSCLPRVRSLAARLEQWLPDDGFAPSAPSGVQPIFLPRDLKQYTKLLSESGYLALGLTWVPSFEWIHID